MSCASVTRNVSKCIVVLLCMGAVFLSTACSSSSKTKAQSGADKSLADFQSKLESASAQVDQTVAATNNLEAPGIDLNKAFKAYQKQVDKIHANSAEASKRMADLKTNSAIRIKDWEEELASLQNAQLREAASERAKIVKSHFDKISEAAAGAKEAYQPFARNLDDLEAYLTQDLSVPSVKASAPVIKEINKSGEHLKEKISAILDEIDALKAEMASVNPPASEAAPADKQ